MNYLHTHTQQIRAFRGKITVISLIRGFPLSWSVMDSFAKNKYKKGQLDQRRIIIIVVEK